MRRRACLHRARELNDTVSLEHDLRARIGERSCWNGELLASNRAKREIEESRGKFRIEAAAEDDPAGRIPKHPLRPYGFDAPQPLVPVRADFVNDAKNVFAEETTIREQDSSARIDARYRRVSSNIKRSRRAALQTDPRGRTQGCAVVAENLALNRARPILGLGKNCHGNEVIVRVEPFSGQGIRWGGLVQEIATPFRGGVFRALVVAYTAKPDREPTRCSP